MNNIHNGQHMSDDVLADKIRQLLKRYFETDVNVDPIPEHDPNYSAQDFY